MINRFYVYIIVNNINSKPYIGWTSKTISHRFDGHVKNLKRKNSNTKFQKAMRKYGWENFYICKLKTFFSKEEAIEYEIKFIKKYDSCYYGYNSTLGGEGTVGLKIKFSKLHRKRLRNAMLGNKRRLGHKHSENSKKKMSKTRKGMKHSIKTKNKISLSHKGKKFSKEHINNLSISHVKCASKKWIVILPNGNKKKIINLKRFANKENLNYGSFRNSSAAGRFYFKYKAYII